MQTIPLASGNERSRAVMEPARRSIVVVEDSADLRLELSELLRENGYEVLEAGDGAAALALMHADPAVDLILLDLWMPRVDGWTFRVRQRSDPKMAHIPVIVLTADASSRAQAIDATRVLSKPCDADTLLDTVAAVLSQHAAPPGAGALLRGTTKLLAEALGHELANPLAILIHSLEILRDRGGSSRASESSPNVDELLEQCWRMVETLRTLRDLTAPPSASPHAVDVVRVLSAAVAATIGTGATLSVPVRPPHVAADEQVLNYVLRAVLRNAAESVSRSESREDPSIPNIRVRVTNTREWVTVQVTDSGPPIPDEELLQIFSPEYPGRGDSWSTGLRLWFVRDALAALGGSVEVANGETGVICSVRIPAAVAPS